MKLYFIFCLIFFMVELNAQCLPDINPTSTTLPALSSMFTATATTPFDNQKIARKVINNASGADLSAKYITQRDNMVTKIKTNFDGIKATNTSPPTAVSYNYLGTTTKYVIKSDNNYCKKIPQLIFKENIASGLFQDTVTMVYKPRMIQIRDNNLPNTAPTILITHGSPFIPLQHTDVFEVMADLAMRGYNVIFYETSASLDLYNINNPPSTDGGIASFERVVYLGYQHAYAAVQFVKANASYYNIDPSKLFLLSGSFGSFASLAAAYADNTNFQNPIYHNSAYGTDLGAKNALVKVGTPDAGDHLFKGICVSAPTLLLGKMGEVFDTNVRKTPSLFIVGGKDTLINPNDMTWINAFAIATKMSNMPSPVWNKTIVNCYGGHGFITEANSIGNIYKYRQQLHQGYILGSFFKFVLENANLNTPCTDRIESISTQTAPSTSTDPCTAPVLLPLSPNGLFKDISNCTCNDTLGNLGPYKQVPPSNETLIVSPNPTQGNLVLGYHSLSDEMASITLYDLQGKIVLQTTNVVNKGDNAYELQLDELPIGLYIVQLRTLSQVLVQKVQVVR